MKTEQKRHIKPPDMPDMDWERLTPIEKARVSKRPQAFTLGHAPTERKTIPGPKEGPKAIGRPRKDGSPPIQRMTVTTPNLPATSQSGQLCEPSFKVTDADSIKDAIETNGLALLNDAYGRAARAATSGDPFDRAVYLTLLGKAHPMAQMGQDKALSGHAKAQMRALNKLIADQDTTDAEFRVVDTPPIGPVQ